MFRKILVPTDGSILSRQAVEGAVLFARNTGATLVGVCVIPPSYDDPLDVWMYHDAAHMQQRARLYENFAAEALAFVANAAQAEGVPCSCKKVAGAEPYLALLDAAEQTRCDLIYMASHGWQANPAQLLSSETLKVVTHSKVPVLVHKPTA